MSEPPQLVDQDEREYHADHSRISHSMLEVFRKSPRLFQGRFLTKEWPGETSSAMDFGKAAHALALESRKVYVPIPASALNEQGHKKGAAWKAFEAEHVGKVLLKPDDITQLESMVASLRATPLARDIVDAPARREVVLRWTDEQTDIPMKCRIDVLRETFEWVADMKTSRTINTRQWAAQAYELGYHRQAALYCDAVESICKTRPKFYFVPMLKEPPYSCDVFELSEMFIHIGKIENAALLLELKQRADAADWSERGAGEIKAIDPPSWAERQFINSL